MTHPKEIYLVGKIRNAEVTVGDFADELEARGHRVLEKWWEKGDLPKPYLDHLDTTTPAAADMLDAAFFSEVTIMFPRDDILGAMAELGAALAGQLVAPEKEVIVVNPFEVRQSVFYGHPGVIAVHGLAEFAHVSGIDLTVL